MQFYHYTGETTDGLWLEGEILQCVTKKDEAKRNNFSINWFNVGKLKLIANLGTTADSIPAKISVNLARNKCWKIASNKPEKNIAKLISSMGTEGRAFHLEANDIVRVEDHRDDVEEDQEETNTPPSNHNPNQNHMNSMYPMLDDESTIRASNSMNSRQAQNKDLTALAPSSMTSMSEISTTSTKRKLRTEDFESFLNNETVLKAVRHLTLLETEQIDNLTVQNTPGQEVVKKALFLIKQLQTTVDRALDSAFSAGALSSGIQNSPICFTT